MRYFLIIAILLFGVTGFAQNKTGSISTGNTYVDLNFTAADTINTSETYWIQINNFQDFPQMLDVWIDLTDVSGTPSVAVTCYGKKFSSDSWTQIGSPVTWTAADFNYPVTTAFRYRYLKIELVASGATQQTLINNIEVKAWNTGGTLSYDAVELSGTLTVAGETTLNDHLNMGAGDDILGSTTSDINFGSGAFTVAGASGNTLVGGTLTATGLITANNGLTLGAGDDLIGSATSDITIGTTAFTVGGATGDVSVGNDLDVVADLTAGTIASDASVTAVTTVESPLYDVDGAAGIVIGSADVLSVQLLGQSEDLLLTPSADTWTLSSATGVTAIAAGGLNLTGVGTIGSGKLSSTAGVDLGTSQALTGTTAITVGSGTATTAITSSDWAIGATGIATGIGAVTIDGEFNQDYSMSGGASVGNIFKQTMAAGETFTGTNGFSFKMYDEDNTVVHNGGEHTGVYVNMKLLSAMQAGGKSVLYSGHNYGSGGDYQVIDAGVWLYGNLVDAFKVSGGSIVTGLDLSETTITGQEILGANSESLDNLTDGVWNMGAADLQVSTVNFADATAVAGTGDAITIDFTADVTVAVGTQIWFFAEAANTTNVTINIDGAGAVAVEEYNGAQSALDGNDIRSGQYVGIVWNGTAYVMITPSGN